MPIEVASLHNWLEWGRATPTMLCAFTWPLLWASGRDAPPFQRKQGVAFLSRGRMAIWARGIMLGVAATALETEPIVVSGQLPSTWRSGVHKRWRTHGLYEKQKNVGKQPSGIVRRRKRSSLSKRP